jgi:hypothetical protein
MFYLQRNVTIFAMGHHFLFAFNDKTVTNTQMVDRWNLQLNVEFEALAFFTKILTLLPLTDHHWIR